MLLFGCVKSTAKVHNSIALRQRIASAVATERGLAAVLADFKRLNIILLCSASLLVRYRVARGGGDTGATQFLVDKFTHLSAWRPFFKLETGKVAKILGCVN